MVAMSYDLIALLQKPLNNRLITHSFSIITKNKMHKPSSYDRNEINARTFAKGV